MKIYNLAIRRGVAFSMLFIALIALGTISAIRLKPELLPNLEFPVISVLTTYQNVSAEDIETLITRPIEEAVSTVSNVKQVISESREGASVVSVEFEWGSNMDTAAADLKDRISLVEDYLPDDASKPLVFKFDPSMIPIAFIGVVGNRPPSELREIADDRVAPALERIDGVALTDVVGGQVREIQVLVDHRKLNANRVSVQQVVNALRAENLNLPGGNVDEGSTTLLVRTTAEFSSVDEIKDVVIRPGTPPLHVRDVAEVLDSFKEQTTNVRVNGKEGVIIRVQKMSGANTVETVEKVKKVMAELNGSLEREGVRLEMIQDQALFINQSLSDLFQSGLIGAILAVVILSLFLHNFRSVLIISISIPAAVIITLFVMDMRGLTLNMMTMSGLALAVGMIVDSAIVVLENIYRQREQGLSRWRSASKGTSEVAAAITASAITTIVVFLPIVFVPGITGLLFRDMALVVVFSLVCSLVVAITLIPLMSSRFLKMNKENLLNRTLGGILKTTEMKYRGLLEWALRHRLAVVLLVLAGFIASILIVYPLKLVGTEFMPESSEGYLSYRATLPVGSSLEETNRVVQDMEAKIKEVVGDDLEAIFALVGSGEGIAAIFRGGAGEHVAQINLRLKEVGKLSRPQKEIETEVLKAISVYPGVDTIVDTTNPGMSGFGGPPISIEIYGYDRETALSIADQIKEILDRIEGVYNVNVDVEKPLPEYRILIDRKKAASLGLNAAVLGDTIQTYIRGTVATRFREGGDEYDVLVRLRGEDRADALALRSLLISTPMGGLVPLESVAKIEQSFGPITIERKKQERYILVTASLKGKDLGTATREIKAEMANINIPDDFAIEFGGAAKDQQESFRWMTIAFLGAIFLIYAVMAAQFESLINPFIIMFTVPLAAMGVIWALALTKTTLNVLSFAGIIMLAGIVVNNGIVMVDYITMLRREHGMGVREAIIEGAQRRLRPVLMTALTTIFAMIPLAIGFGSGSEMRTPLARAVVGGLTTSTFLTLIFVPVIYSLFSKFSRMKQMEELE